MSSQEVARRSDPDPELMLQGLAKMTDHSELERFVVAQDALYTAVLDELRVGHKRTHWMWFIFPQIAGLGSSPTARMFALATIREAREYLAHPILGPRLKECTQLVLAIQDRTLQQIFGSPDDLKFRSCMTLFAHVAPDECLFAQALAKFCRDEPDERTLALLG